MKKAFSIILSIILALGLVLPLATVALAAPMPGAIWTTDGSGNPVNQNIYESRLDVWLNGGPKSAQFQGLPDGLYYVQVTAPNGTLLGSSIGGLSTDTPVYVTGGRFYAPCSLWYDLVKASDSTQEGYDVTPNPGGEYKVWISMDPTFPNNGSKTDNFKVRSVSCDGG